MSSDPTPAQTPAQTPIPGAPPPYPPGYAQTAVRPAYLPGPQFRSPLQWRAYVRANLEAGQPIGRMLGEMAGSGIGPELAYGLIADVLRDMRDRAVRFLIGSGLFAAAGAVASFATLQFARSTGGSTYLVWYGPVIVGAIGFIYGLYLFFRVPKLPR